MSVAASDLLAARTQFTIHSVFDSAVNLRGGRRLLTCTARALSAPHGIEMTAGDLHRLREQARTHPATVLRWDATRRQFADTTGRFALAAARATVFDASLPCVDQATFAAGAAHLLGHLSRHRPTTGFGDDWPGLAADARGAEAVDALVAGRVDAAVLAWLGLGPGLTPSGDDLLLGIIAAAHSTGALTPGRAGMLGRSLDVAARARTTEISVEYLHYACRGMAAGPLRELLRALGRGGGQPAIQAVDRLRAYGHTSGMDTTLGVIVAARSLAAPRAA